MPPGSDQSALVITVVPFVGLLVLVLSFQSSGLPAWLFPVRGRWLAYLLRGLGLFLMLPWLPFLPMLIAGVAVAAWLAGAVEQAVTGQDSCRAANSLREPY
ncbi:MAG: hypothetical protein K0Q72_1420 [Armatimonadetes bacterium]|jgi:hypothetical protein|nr:hypothetical protein [Armatimonadota bacterium]